METSWFTLLARRRREPLAKDLLPLLRPKCKEIIKEEELKKLLSKKSKLRVKLGVDPTGSELHLGHAVPLMLLNIFERAGHQVHFIIGDFTAQIGDPAGRLEKRKELSRKDVEQNMKSYRTQIAPLINLKEVTIRRNSEWLGSMKLESFFKVLGAVSFGDMAQREDFRARIKLGAGVSLREANYAVLMGIDSLETKADIEVGGIDQMLNFMETRDIMSAAGSIPEVVLMTPILEGTAGDGRKMSKSFNNYVALSASAEEQFGQIMSIPDKLILSYFISFGDIYENEIEKLDEAISKDPFALKKELGLLVVSLLHGEKDAHEALQNFERRFSKKEYSKEDETLIRASLPRGVLEALGDAYGKELSKNKIRALLDQGGVRKMTAGGDMRLAAGDSIGDGDLIKVGRRSLFRFKKK